MRKFAILAGILLLIALTVAQSAALARGGMEKGAVHTGGMARVKVVGISSRPPLLPVVAQSDILPEDQIFLDRILRSLPPLCTQNLEQVVVRYTENAERGQATATTMILRGPLASLPENEKKEMAAVIVHELCGHGVDLGMLRGTRESGESAYPDGHIATFNDDPSAAFYAISWKNSEEKFSEARKDHFVTGYAMHDPFEDIAESITYFALQEQAFRERAAGNPVLAAKLRWIETYVFPEGKGLALGAGWNGSIAWDATKIAYEGGF
ncbi:MAG: hypothetical protein AAB853_01100 [Patescibacteria group bacterium]